ncbi:hypothetical protein [Limnoglobus roseus]|nr:hypothetical protein [Limnoglobus roseus]
MNELAQPVEKEIQARGNQRLTARQFAEMAAVFKWVPAERVE